MGVVNANPTDYIQRYGETLKSANQLPEMIKNIPVQGNKYIFNYILLNFSMYFFFKEGIVLAADYHFNHVHQLEGDVEALKLIDLEAEGLSCYRNQLSNSGLSSSSFSIAPSVVPIATTTFLLHNETLDSQIFSESELH